jgi:hypothetical protein
MPLRWNMNGLVPKCCGIGEPHGTGTLDEVDVARLCCESRFQKAVAASRRRYAASQQPRRAVDVRRLLVESIWRQVRKG